MNSSLIWRMVRRALPIALCALIILGIGTAFDHYEAKPYPGEPSHAELLAGLRYAMAATGKPMAENVDSFHRGRATGLSSMTDMSMSLDESKIDIESHMNQSGWHLVKSKTGTQGTEYLKFCKNSVAAIFDSRDSYSPKRVFVSTIWAESPRHDGYCRGASNLKESSDPTKDGQS